MDHRLLDHLPPKIVQQATAFAAQRSDGLQAELGLYLARQPPFLPHLFKSGQVFFCKSLFHRLCRQRFVRLHSFCDVRNPVHSLDPATWWKAGERAGFPPGLSTWGLQLSQLPSSAADLERVFSAVSCLTGKNRCRFFFGSFQPPPPLPSLPSLDVEKLGKLAFVHRALTQQQPVQPEGDEDEDEAELSEQENENTEEASVYAILVLRCYHFSLFLRRSSTQEIL